MPCHGESLVLEIRHLLSAADMQAEHGSSRLLEAGGRIYMDRIIQLDPKLSEAVLDFRLVGLLCRPRVVQYDCSGLI